MMGEYCLNNGIEVVTKNQKERNIVSFGFWFNFGFMYESYGENGITHFLEHIVNNQKFVQYIEDNGGIVDCLYSAKYNSLPRV